MAYTRQIGTDFWFDFDNQFMWNPAQSTMDALVRAFNFGGGRPDFDRPVDFLRASFGTTAHPADFLASVSPNRAGFVDVSRLQLTIIRAHLASRDDIQAAFE